MKNIHVCFVVVSVAATLSCLAEPKPNRELAHLPAPVRKAIRAKLGDAHLVSIEKDEENGDTTYDVEMTKDTRTRAFTVDAEGGLVDEQVFLDEIPAPVQNTIKRHAAGQSIDEIDKSVDDDLTSYEVEESRGDVTRSFVVDDDGILLQSEVFPNELPARVRATIEKETANATVDEIDRTDDEGSAFYCVEMTRENVSREFTVDGTGAITEMEVLMTELPEALQTAIHKTLGNAEPDEIDKEIEEGDVSYDVAAGDKTYTFDPDGELSSLEEDVHLADAPAPVQEQIKTLIADGKLSDVSRTTEDGEITYDIDWVNAGMDKSATLSAEGKVMPEEN